MRHNGSTPLRRNAMDYDEDKNKRDLWLQNTMTETMCFEDFVRIASQKLETCQDYCESREECGEDACLCVRRRFPSPEHYKLYKIVNSRFNRMLTAATMAKAVALATNGDRDVED